MIIVTGPPKSSAATSFNNLSRKFQLRWSAPASVTPKGRRISLRVASADLLVDLFAASHKGEFAAADPTLERLLGRPLLSMRDVLTSHLSSKQQS